MHKDTGRRVIGLPPNIYEIKDLPYFTIDTVLRMYYYSLMSKKKPMTSISFRLPVEAVKELKKKIEYTRWVQNVVLLNMGRCPVCTSQLPHKKEGQLS